MDLEMKSLDAEVKAVEDDSPTGAFEAILSTKSVDRDGESILPGAFEPLPARIPLYHQHDWLEKALPVGSGEPFYDGDVLKIKGSYASTARGQEMRALVTEGHVPSMSVGFISAKKSRGVIRKAELIEGSFTGVPVNTTAAVLASKSFEARVKAADSTAANVENSDPDARQDAELVQAMHDMAAQMHAVTMGMGADCPGDAAGKAMGHAHVHSHGRMKAVSEGASPIAQPAMLRHFHDHMHPAGAYDHTGDEQPHEHSHGKSLTPEDEQYLEARKILKAEGRLDESAAAELKAEFASADDQKSVEDIDGETLNDAHPETKAAAAGAPAATADAQAEADEQEELELRARALGLMAI